MILHLLACELFGIETLDLQDEVDDYTEPYVVQSWLVGVAPLDVGLELPPESNWSSGAVALAFIGNASEVGDLEKFPVKGASVDVRYASGARAGLPEVDAGTYSGNGFDQALTYDPAQEVELVVYDGGVAHAVAMSTVRAPDLDIPQELPRGEPFVIDISGLGYEGLLAVVIDLQTQTVLYDNTPTSAIEILDFLNGDRPLRVEVPGEVFDRDSVFAIGVAGLVSVEDDAYTEFNTELSRVMAGQVRFTGTSTIPLD